MGNCCLLLNALFVLWRWSFGFQLTLAWNYEHFDSIDNCCWFLGYLCYGFKSNRITYLVGSFCFQRSQNELLIPTPEPRRPTPSPVPSCSAASVRSTKRRASRDADDEFDGIGVNVSCKLRRMGEEQQIYAEMLINQILMNGLKGRLWEETELCELKRPPVRVSTLQKAVNHQNLAELNFQ